MATFEDNTAVTLADLNNIAVDLGDATFSAFSESKFGVDKLNEITADLVSKGVLATGNKCEVTLRDANSVYVNPGIIVFGSGAKIKLTSRQMVSAPKGYYIYAFNNPSTGRASLTSSSARPTSGDYVLLAQHSSSGAIIDMREMSVANVKLSVEVQNTYVEQTVAVSSGNEFSTNYAYLTYAVVPDLPQCRLLVLKEVDISFIETSGYTYVCGGVELSEDYQQIYHIRGSQQYEADIYVKKVDGVLYFELPIEEDEVGSAEGTFTFLLA